MFNQTELIIFIQFKIFKEKKNLVWSDFLDPKQTVWMDTHLYLKSVMLANIPSAFLLLYIYIYIYIYIERERERVILPVLHRWIYKAILVIKKL